MLDEVEANAIAILCSLGLTIKAKYGAKYGPYHTDRGFVVDGAVEIDGFIRVSYSGIDKDLQITMSQKGKQRIICVENGEIVSDRSIPDSAWL